MGNQRCHSPIIHVAAAAIVNDSREVLIALRPDHVHQGGLWEFPGGKVESNETVVEALHRELLEELGITALDARPLIRLHHNYPDKSVLLDVWLVRHFSGTPHGREGQPIKWVEVGSLSEFCFPAANVPIITALQLPIHYLITPSPGDNHEHFLVALEKSLQQAIKLVQFRAPGLKTREYLGLAAEVLQVCQQSGAQLLLNCDPKYVAQVGAQGVHLTSARLQALSARPLSKDFWVGASCHNAAEIAHANQIGVDFGVLAPVLATQTHPHSPLLGWERFGQLVETANFPVYALGGLSVGHLDVAHAHGAQGISAIRSLWAGVV